MKQKARGLFKIYLPVAKIALHLEGRYDEKGQPATPYSPQVWPASLLAKYTEREMCSHVYHN
jgi:hypothetical protein